MTESATAPLLRTVSVVIARAAGLGRWEVAFESEAIPGTLAVFAGTLALRRLDIASAIVLKTPDGMVRGTFDVAPLGGGRFGVDDAPILASLATAGLRGTRDIDAELRASRRSVPAPERAEPVRVETCSTSELTTGVTVRAADRLGLLHDIAATLTRHGLRTRSITVLTYGGQAHDSFRVVDGSGAPVRDETALAALRADLAAVCGAAR